MRISSLCAAIIKNSRNEDTIKVTVNNTFSASVPSGASRGSHEVQLYHRKGISASVQYINALDLKKMTFETFEDLKTFDHLIPIIGGNSVLALQLAILKSMSENNIAQFLNPKPKLFPIPLGNVIGGGAHTKEVSTDIQEYLLIPKAKTMSERITINKEVHTMIGKMLGAKKKTDEGAWIPKLSTEETFNVLSRTIESYPVSLGIDCAATQLYKKQSYVYNNALKERRKVMYSQKEHIEKINNWIRTFKLKYVEDPLYEDDFKGFSKISQNKTLVCGDDLICTNIERLKAAVKEKAINAVIIKPNQCGSLTKTKKVLDFAVRYNITPVISHRSGETMDTWLAHLAVGWKIPYIKTGIWGKERETKLNELIRLEENS